MSKESTITPKFNGTSEVNSITKTYFPTSIAVHFAVPMDLFPEFHVRDMKEGRKKEKELKKAERLKWFQELSMHGDVEDAMIAYHDVELKPKQKKILEIIFSLTRKQARGHLTNEIFKKIKAGCDSRDVKSLGELLMALNEDGEGGVVGKAFEALVINTTKR